MLEALPIGIMTFDASGQCYSANEAMAGIIGGSLELVRVRSRSAL
jgi:hypothetical protein